MQATSTLPPADPTRSGSRPQLLVLVYGVFLVLIAVTATALLSITSGRIETTSLQGVVGRDRALVALFVRDHLRASDLSGETLTATRAASLGEEFAALTSSDDILSIELLGNDGTVLASDQSTQVGTNATESQGLGGALGGAPSAEVTTSRNAAFAATDGWPDTVIQEYLPILANGEQLGVVALWRDAADLVASISAARSEVLSVTLVAAAVLAMILFLLFRAAHQRLVRQQELLLQTTREDSLTGLLNHGAVVAQLATVVEAAKRDTDRVGVALIDIDNFRLLNDTHTHAAGDDILVRVAGLLPAGGRASDQVARYGPDEFLVVRSGADAAQMQELVAGVRERIGELHVQFGDSEALPVTVSAGVAVLPDHATAVTELLAAAASALGRAKLSGGDQVCLAEETDHGGSSGTFNVLQGLVIAVDHKDRYTRRHSEDVARYAVFLGRLLGLDEHALQSLHLSGLLHDVGKIAIPDTILRKPGKLTRAEYEVFQRHVELGDAIVRDVPNIEAVRAGVRTHHERWDGKGYLSGMEGEEIPLIGRIMAVADAFSAMTTSRPYRRALSVEEAIKRLGDAAGSQLEEPLVVTFIRGLESEPDAPMPGDDTSVIWLPNLRVA